MFNVMCRSGSVQGFYREINQDNFAISDILHDNQNGNMNSLDTLDGLWAVVSDGMGGHPGGEVASKIVASYISSYLESAFVTNLPNALAITNHLVISASIRNSSLQNMGATVAGIAFTGNTITAFSAGDTRIYKLIDETYELITIDDADQNGHLTCYMGLKSYEQNSAKIIQIPICGIRGVLICTDGYYNNFPGRPTTSSATPFATVLRADTISSNENGSSDDATFVEVLFRVP